MGFRLFGFGGGIASGILWGCWVLTEIIVAGVMEDAVM